jgi:MFS family permease
MISKNYLLLISSIIINKFGDVLFDLFITWKITVSTGEILNAVYLIGSSIIFRAILALFIGILVDTYNKKRLIIVSNISSIIVLLALFIFWKTALNHIWIGVFFILLNDINNEIFARSYISISAELFNQEQFIKFQASYTIANRVIAIAGSSISGFMIAYIDTFTIFLIDILTFIISALLISIINYTYIHTNKRDAYSLKKVILIDLIEDLKFTFFSLFESPYILKFIILMFILNFAYGYIPYILPITISNNNADSILFGLIKSSMAIGEILGLLFITKIGKYVSILFKISMIGNLISMLLFMITNNSYITILIFGLYGMFDAYTQPLFGYTISLLDSKNRGKIIGGIDMIILLSPSIGMFIFSNIMKINIYFGYMLLSFLFMIGYLIVLFSKEMNNIILANKK